MSNNTTSLEELMNCICLKTDDMVIEDLQDADFHDPACPVHGICARILKE